MKPTFPFLCVAFCSAAVAASDLDQPQLFRAARSSSYARDGANGDRVIIEPKATQLVADIKGAGRIVHMWFIIGTAEKNYLSTTKLRIYWDGNAKPAVDVPFGLFHALGHSTVRTVRSAFITVEGRPELNQNLQNPNAGGFNSYFAMPFATAARVVIENTSDQLIRLYYQIDYQKWKTAPSPLRFHAAHGVSRPEPYPGPRACELE